MSWSLYGAWVWIVIGFMLALVLEGFLLIGGRTILTGLLGWKTAPPLIQNILNTGHTKLLDAMNIPKSCRPK